jgi:hypothetical protein
MTEQLPARGDRVAATLRKPVVLAARQERYPQQVRTGLDVTDDDAIHAVMARAFAAPGHIDGCGEGRRRGRIVVQSRSYSKPEDKRAAYPARNR